MAKKRKTWEERQDDKEVAEIAAKTTARKTKAKPFAFPEDDSLKFVCISGDGLYGKFGLGHTCDEAIEACKKAGAKLAEHGFYVKVTDSKSLTIADDGGLSFYVTEKFPHGPKYAATRRHGRTQETFFYEPFVDVPMKEDVKLADLTALEQRRPMTWLGWVVFAYEVSGSVVFSWKHSCWLFRERPEEHAKDIGGWRVHDQANPGISVPPAFLDACGLDVPWQDPEFYKGEGCQRYMHPPIKIALTLPRALLQALKLLPED